MKKSFSLIELVIVILVIGILYYSINVSTKNTTLNQAIDQLISHINYTRHLGIRDNKMQYYPINSSDIETNRSKYWFKQWWQLRIGQTTSGDYFYEIFSDSPESSTIYDHVGNPVSEFAIDPYNQKYMSGNYGSEPNRFLNLSQYNIKKIKFNGITLTTGNSIRFIFDSYGNVYTSEGGSGDSGDINPYDFNQRRPLLETGKLTLCQDDNCEENMSICISSKIGNVYICD